jgi:List-Bact-rpt repeat protein
MKEMGHESTVRGILARASIGACVLALVLLAFSSSAFAASGPFHLRKASLDVTGLNHACGVATDNKGDLYASSAGEGKIKVYDPSHVLLTEISNANTPCGLAVTTTGALYVSEKATGEVVRYKPNAYPFVGTPTYGAREVIDASGKAKGIAVDRFDSRLFVAEGTKVAVYTAEGAFEANLGEGTLTEASGVAAYTNTNGTATGDRYLWVADASGVDRLYLFEGQSIGGLKLRRELTGSTTPDGSFGFGTAGAYLAADPGNRSGNTCNQVGEQACTSGHFVVYDAAHNALDEFDASGEYLDQVKSAILADAEPTQVAVERSGGSNDGTLYVSAGAGAGAKLLAFEPLGAPSREQLPEPLSHVLATAQAVAVDSKGNVYVSFGAFVRIYSPAGAELVKFEDAKTPLEDLAVDSTGKVYVQESPDSGITKQVTYYTPSAYPPTGSTTYARHEPPVIKASDFPEGSRDVRSIAVNPKNNHLFVTSSSYTIELGSAAEGSPILKNGFASTLNLRTREEVDVDPRTGNVYFGSNPRLAFIVDPVGTEIIARINGAGSPSGLPSAAIVIAVDPSNGHVILFNNKMGNAREYDASGAFVTEFGSFNTEAEKPFRVAVDGSSSSSKGNVYVAYDDPEEEFDATAFGPVEYPQPPERKLTVKKTGSGSGKVTSSPVGIDCGSTCSAQFDSSKPIKLTAKADPGSEFVKWTGCEAEPSATECEVMLSADSEVKAEFKEEEGGTKHKLTVITEGAGSGDVTSEQQPGIECPSTCAAEFGANVNVRLIATPEGGSEVVGWSGCDAQPSETECEVKMTGPKEVKVEFGVEHPLLSVIRKGSGTGTVTSSPAGIDCGLTCAFKFDLNDEVTLTAEADEGSVFVGWEGCDAEPSEAECEVEMPGGPRKVTATFDPLPRVTAKSAQPILYREATLRGEVDPAGFPTEYRFEYLTEEDFEGNGETFEGGQHTPEVKLAAATGFIPVTAPLVGLEEGTEYRFRLRAMSSVGSAEDEGVFETLQRNVSPPCLNAEYRIGLSAKLPDCRAYELVTPGETGGASITAHFRGNPGDGFNNWLTVPRGPGAGEALSFETSTTLPGFEGSGVTDGYRSERAPGLHPEDGWSTALVSPSYVQGGGTPNGASALNGSSDQLYSFWKVNPKYPFEGALDAGTYLRTPSAFEVAAQGGLGDDPAGTSQFVSPAGAHVLFSSEGHLETDAPLNGIVAIYDRKAGEASAEVISVQPGGSPFAGDAIYLGSTEDGSAVAFKVGGVLYLHRDGVITEIAASPNTFAGLSEDGSRVFYANAASQPAGIFACDTGGGPCAGPEAHAPTAIAANATFVNVSADGSHVFFTSTDPLTPPADENEDHQHAESGQHNLYAWDGVGTSFIAILDPQDLTAFGGELRTKLGAWTEAIAAGSDSGFADSPARSTPNGEVFLFQSHAQLSAYDNEGFSEIYRYAPGAPSGERLSCISCDPGNASPSGDAKLEPFGLSTTGVDRKGVIPNLTADGATAFFHSPGRLLPEDANDVTDVYEWRAHGSAGCMRVRGCLALISSGQGESDSFLYAMSADGHDVFIRTKEKLVGQDVPGSYSIYDARVEGGIPDPPTKAPCQGDACQGAGSPPPVLPGPATTGSGNGNVESKPPAPCGKKRHRVKGRCVPIKHRKHRKRRAGHHRRAGR